MNPHSFEKSQKTIPPICQRILKKIRNHLEQSPKKLLRESIKYLSFGRGAFETERNRVSRGAKHPPKKKKGRKWRAMATTTSALTTQSTRS